MISLNKRYKKARSTVSENYKEKIKWYSPIIDIFKIPVEMFRKNWRGLNKTYHEILFGNLSRTLAAVFLIIIIMTPPIYGSYRLMGGPGMIKSSNEVQAIPLVMALDAYGLYPDDIKETQYTSGKQDIYLFKEGKQIYKKDNGAGFELYQPIVYPGQYWNWPFDAGLEAIQFEVDHSAKSGASQINYDRSYMLVDPDDSVSGIPNVKLETTPFWISDWQGIAADGDLVEGTHYEWWSVDFFDEEEDQAFTIEFITGYVTTNFIITVWGDKMVEDESFAYGGKAWVAESAGQYTAFWTALGSESWLVGGSPADITAIPQVTLHQWVVDDYESNPQVERIGSGFMSAQMTEMSCNFVNYVDEDGKLMEEVEGWIIQDGTLDSMSGSVDVSMYETWENALEISDNLDEYSEYDLNIDTQLHTTIYPNLWASAYLTAFASDSGPPNEFIIEKAAFIYQVTFKIATGYRMPFVGEGEIDVTISKSAGPPPSRDASDICGEIAGYLGLSCAGLIGIVVTVLGVVLAVIFAPQGNNDEGL